MKTSYFTISVVLLFTSLFAAGQAIDPAKPVQRSRITKGYYSIGNQVPVIDTGTRLTANKAASNPTKGYYSIQQDTAKLGVSSGWLLPQRKRPVIKKGYYSISEEHMQRFPRPDKR
ncbi:MAG: hypothetical protein INR73_02215 [Williamsia sp.]|nr:hypothetical protein [Williamsia sp.]